MKFTDGLLVFDLSDPQIRGFVGGETFIYWFCISGAAVTDLVLLSLFSGSHIAAVTEDFADLYYRLEDISSSLREIRERITFTPEELDNAIARLSLIDGLKRKYGSSIEEILAYRDRIDEELSQIENFDQVKTQLEADVKAS